MTRVRSGENISRCNHPAGRGLAWEANNFAGRTEMKIAPEITFEGSEPSPAAREMILKEIERLETHNQRITGCRVTVIAPSHKHRHGTGFQVHIWLTIPPHENIVVNHSATDDARHEHAQVAIKDAFAAARCGVRLMTWRLNARLKSPDRQRLKVGRRRPCPCRCPGLPIRLGSFRVYLGIVAVEYCHASHAQNATLSFGAFPTGTE
jgi:ribosome-associated translation inhibitor RaiA